MKPVEKDKLKGRLPTKLFFFFIMVLILIYFWLGMNYYLFIIGINLSMTAIIISMVQKYFDAKQLKVIGSEK